MTIDPIPPASLPVATQSEPLHVNADSPTLASSDGITPAEMEKFMMQLMQTYSFLKDDDDPDASPTLKANPDLF